MAGRHTAADVDFGALQEEQRNIDVLIESLLNYSSIPVANCAEQKDKRNIGTTAANTPTQVKKPRGRPPKQNLPPPSPTLANSSPRTSVSDTKPSFGSVIECLKKISDQNKKLLNLVEVLSDKVEKNNNTESKENDASEPGISEVQTKRQLVL